MKLLRRAWIMDIDGTLADTDHRIHHIKPPEGQKKNWGKFFAEAKHDKTIEHVEYMNTIIGTNGLEDIFLITARPENLRKDTEAWLDDKRIWYTKLFMRPVNERKPDYEVKRDIYNEHFKGKYKILGVFEDRLQVAKMWREEGLPVFLVGDDWLKGDWGH